MTGYQLLFLDEFGRIRHRLDLDCPDDDGARALATRQQPAEDMELWQGERLVERYQYA